MSAYGIPPRSTYMDFAPRTLDLGKFSSLSGIMFGLGVQSSANVFVCIVVDGEQRYVPMNAVSYDSTRNAVVYHLDQESLMLSEVDLSTQDETSENNENTDSNTEDSDN